MTTTRIFLWFGQFDFRQANSILRKISSILCDNSKHNIHLVEYSVWKWRSRNLTDFPWDQLWLGHRDSSTATWQWPETSQCWCTCGGSCWLSFRMRLGWSFCHRDVSSGCPTNRGSRNLTNGHQVLQLDNGLELFNLLSLYPAEGFCGPLCFDFSGSDFGSTFSHLITIWWISLDLTGITTLIPWKWNFDLVRQTYTCV